MRRFGDTLEGLLAGAIALDERSSRDREIAKVLASVCFSALVTWATGIDTDVRKIVHDVAGAMLAPGSVGSAPLEWG